MNDTTSIRPAPVRPSPGGRDRGVDIAKGIGIALVVLGHAWVGLGGALGPDRWRDAALIVVYTFHMALFFVLSGAFAGRSASEPRAAFARRLWRGFVHPYLLWSLILLGTGYLMRGHTNTPVDRLDLVAILYRPPAVMWFLYVLLGAFVLLRVTARRSAPARLLLAVTLAVGGYFLSFWLTGHLRFVGLFLLAAQFGLPSPRALSRRGPTWASIAAMAATAVLAWREAAHGLTGYPGQSIVYLPAAFAGPWLVLRVSAWLARSVEHGGPGRPLGRLLSTLGRHTLPIFVLHILFTAGVRIALMGLGVHDAWAIGIAATGAGVFVPLGLALAAQRLGVAHCFAWPAAPRPA